MSNTKPKELLNLGAGRQSSYLFHASGLGILPKFDLAVFGDTGDEPDAVYRHLQWLIDRHSGNYGIPIVTVGTRSIAEDALRSREAEAEGLEKARSASMPWHVKNPDGSKGMVNRQCTSEYKIMVIERYIKTEVLGLKVADRWPIQHAVRQWFGISSDEWQRMRKPVKPHSEKVEIGKDLSGEPVFETRKTERPIKWKSHAYPLCNLEWRWNANFSKCERIELGTKQMTADDCINWHANHGLPLPPKSACKKCPYRSNQMWREMRDNSPEEFAEACDFDDAIRSSENLRGEMFTHSELIPLRNVDLDKGGDDDLPLFPCDGGVCGV